ncbi:type II and III secretion system protein family protein [Methylocystis sp. JAN1]|uniref:type II and III secretion system protein family protein n=1 Tax=Methylocystis sp. JAN1 TaxID=3397211 RepID=UPI003FA268E9
MRRVRAYVSCLAIISSALGFAASLPATAYAKDEQSDSARSAVKMTLFKNKAKNIRLNYPFADATVGAPDIADIYPISDRQLYVVGKSVGRTNVLLFDNEKRLIGSVDVDVKLDDRAMSDELQTAAGVPGVQVQDVDENIVLRGRGRDAPSIARAVSAAQGLSKNPIVNAMKLGGSQQVMLKVRFVEANRAGIRAFGVRWQAILNNRLAGAVGRTVGRSTMFNNGLQPGATGAGGSATVPGAAVGPYVNGQPFNGALPIVFDVVQNALTRTSPTATIIAQLVNTGGGSLDAVISALEEQNVIRSLAEPNLVALSGESAEFIAGGQIPVPVPQAGSFGAAAFVTIQWKDFGVKLNFTPTVLEDKVISLKLEPEVSDLDYTNAVTINNITVPAIVLRRARTTVELRDGQSFAIAGLIQEKSQRDVEQLPWLGSVPVLGALFRSTEFQKRETELVALVTPHLVKPVPPGNKDPRLKTPLDTTMAGNDFDLFVRGKAELSKTPPTYLTETGVEQPLAGGIAPGAPETAPTPVASPDPLTRFFGALTPQQSYIPDPQPSAPQGIPQ